MKVNAMRGSAASVALISLALLGGCATTSQTAPAAAPAPAPAPAPATKPAPPPPAKSSQKTAYTVMKGDNLWDISGMHDIYGNPYEWPLIYKANAGKIHDPDLIFPGENLKINQDASTMEIDAAIYHAKRRGAWKLGQPTSSDLKYLKESATAFLKMKK